MLRRTLSLVTATVATSAAALVATAGPALAAEVPTQRNITYTISTSRSYTAADTLGNAIGWGKNRTVDWVMEHANRALAPQCEAGSNGALQPLAAAAGRQYGFCWREDGTSDDDPDGAWYPQGITSTADAYGADYYDGVQAVAVTWYHEVAKYARLTLAPIYGYGSGGNTYRHLLLAAPTGGGTDFSEVNCHAGGAMWYGDMLYVACTDRIKLFSFKHIFSADTSADCAAQIGKVGGKYCASGYAYIMLQVGQIVASGPAITFSTISLDRAATPDKLVIGEYSTSPGAGLWRFNLDSSTRLPSSYYYDAWSMPFSSVQGVTTRDTKFWFHSSGGVITSGETIQDNYGKLRFWNGQATSAVKVWTGAYGAESLSYFGDDSSEPDTLFTLSEHPGYRGVIAIQASDFD